MTSLVSAPAGPVFAQTAPAGTSVVSVERIEKALERPPSIFDMGLPTFSISVVERLDFEHPFGVAGPRKRQPAWLSYFTNGPGAQVAGAVGLAAVTASAAAGDGDMSLKPLVAMDVLAVATVVAGKVQKALHNRKLRKTHEKVRKELEEFCAANGCVVPPDSRR